MDILIAITVLALGFVLLIKGADYLVEGSVGIARRFGLSELIVGLTIVSFGTSAPELVVNVTAAFQGKDAVITSNILGSNIFNLCFILGVTGMIYPLQVQGSLAHREWPFSLLVLGVIALCANDIGQATEVAILSKLDGGILMLLFGGLMVYLLAMAQKEGVSEEEQAKEGDPKDAPVLKHMLYIIGGLLALVLGGRLALDQAVYLASELGLTERVIGLTVIAVGTSLPELATSVVAALKKNNGIAVGNVVGSNLFNSLFILGGSLLVAPRPIVYQTATNMDLLFLSGMTGVFLCFLAMNGYSKKEKAYPLKRWQALFLILAIVSYTIKLLQN